MHRRAFLATAGLASGHLLTTSCAGNRRASTPAAAAPTAPRFAKVNVSPERIIRTVCGLRPYRPAGFVVRAEKLDGKLLIHNYGHGGGGVTLSWGTAHLAVEEARTANHQRAAVIGAGAVGLATGILLQQTGRDVTIYAKSLPPDTTSNIAGAQWFPFSVFDPNLATPVFRDQFIRAATFSYQWYQRLAGPRYAVRWLPNYFLSPESFSNDGLIGPQGPLGSLMPGLRDLAPAEHPFPYTHVRTFYTMMVEPAPYLTALLQDFRGAGGRIAVREFASPQEILQLPEPLIVNCTGLGSRALFDDQTLIPVKGQLSFLLPQPEIEYLLLAGPHYMFPRQDGILLGGSFERNVWDLAPDPALRDRMLAGHAELFGALG